MNRRRPTLSLPTDAANRASALAENGYRQLIACGGVVRFDELRDPLKKPTTGGPSKRWILRPVGLSYRVPPR